jgi:superfamily II DNA or RNA helicase/phage anti-repressor protein
MTIPYTHKVGFTYEYFVLDQIKNDYDKVWHWRDFPEKLMYDNNLIKDYDTFCKYRYDIGADLVALKNDKYYFIQCKNYNDTILMENLAGFYFLLYEYNLTGILYYNGKLSQRVLDLTTNKIQFINLPFNNSTIDIIQDIKKPLITRDYQLEAYNKLLYKNKSILSLPCGMGKTYTTSLMAKHYDNIIILSPLRYLAFQTLEHYKIYLGSEYSPILISLDGKRKMDDINNYIKDKNIISSTYDSVDVVIQLLDKLKNIYLIVDEFHNLSNNNINDKNNDMYKIINNTYDKIFISATPLMDFMNITDIYNYNWTDAINNKYICDFTIYIPDKNENYEKFVELLKTSCNNNINEKIIKKAYFMLKSILFNGDRKCICYITNINNANNMMEILSWMGKLLGVHMDYWQIDYNTKKTIREKIINNFKESKNIAIIINVHILDEGINISECDSVFITQPNNNIINIIQRMCRANRILDNKTACNIYLWCKEEKTKLILDYINENTQGFIKNKVYIYNTGKRLIEKHKMEINNLTNNLINYDDNLINYIKQFNIIPSTFIDTFFSLYTTETTENDLIINFDNLVVWLNMRKDNLKKTLIATYIKNIDYKIKKIKSTTPGKPKEEIMITADCCKRLCMLSKTKKAEEVRTYFIEIEKLMNKYKNYIIEALNKQVGVLENNQKPIPNNKGGIIYVLKTDKDIVDLYKLGKTKKFKERIKTHNSSHIDNVDIVHIYETDYIDEVEKCLKNVLSTKQYRKRKEFYQIDLDVLKELIKTCDKMSLKVRKNNKNIQQNGGYFIMLESNN